MDKIKAARRKFLYFFRGGFYGDKYLGWERDYKWNAHLAWEKELNKKEYERLLHLQDYEEIARRAVRIESRTNLLFSFEKMALRDALKMKEGAQLFAKGLFQYVYGRGSLQKRFEEWVMIVAALPRKQTRVLTWPLVTVFGFIANPKAHIFLKPVVTRTAAEVYGYDFIYRSKPNWETYQSLHDFAETVRKNIKDLKPRDHIDIQSFIWVLGSSEYEK